MDDLWGPLSEELTGWTLTMGILPLGTWGLTNFKTRQITIDRRLLTVEARCTLHHEAEHARRGPVPYGLAAREEYRVNKIVARTLLPDLRAVADALNWADWRLPEAADELGVDEDTLQWRLETLTTIERLELASAWDEDDPTLLGGHR